jgi:hypothetical protein
MGWVKWPVRAKSGREREGEREREKERKRGEDTAVCI